MTEENENETPTMDGAEEPQDTEEQGLDPEEQQSEPRQDLGEKVSTSPGRGVLKAAFFLAAGASLAGGILSAVPYMDAMRYSESLVEETASACKVARRHHLQFFFDGDNHSRMLRDTYTVRQPAEREEEPWERLESQTFGIRYAKEIGYGSPDIVVLMDNGADGTVDEIRTYTLTWDLSNGTDGSDWFSAPAVTREELDDGTAALLDTILADYRERMGVETHCD